ncbi:MAG TPA: hypothetical protein PK014_10265 [Thermoanaerobaculia bacterium]|nr:hypothetical protein [Thermoanaerobaculia bacterium]HUM30503.1 hypothetical protein [Thermoanaerobaculia bacterium]HXK68630.1 hypothetical protein [Thermoanaerobaculia bacterium]
MRILFKATLPMAWHEVSPGLPTCAAIVHNLSLQGLWGVCLTMNDRLQEETGLIRQLAPVHINYMVNAIPEQIRSALDGKPDSVTIWNDKREDRCYDPQLFARQLDDAVQPLKLERTRVRLYIEPEPDLVKETHRQGIGSIFLHFTKDTDKITRSIQTGQKLGMSIYIAGIEDWESLHIISRFDSLTGIVLDVSILRYIMELGSREALSSLTAVFPWMGA